MNRINFWTDLKSWKNTIITSVVCIVICIVCELSILSLLELRASIFGVEAMIYAFLLATFCSTFLQTLYNQAKDKSLFFSTFKRILSMVFCSMVGMFLADFIFHSTYFQGVETHHQHQVGGTQATPYMYVMMSSPLAIIAMFVGGLICLLPYNYYQYKKHGKCC